MPTHSLIGAQQLHPTAKLVTAPSHAGLHLSPWPPGDKSLQVALHSTADRGATGGTGVVITSSAAECGSLTFHGPYPPPCCQHGASQ